MDLKNSLITRNDHQMDFFKSTLCLNDLNIGRWDIHENRKKARVCVIDDNPFSHKEAIENIGYNLKEIGDIDNVSQCIDYDIIVCDIRGVGKSYKSDLEGAYIIKELRTKYPDKFIVMYSSSNFTARFQPYLKFADEHLKKTDDFNEWSDALDFGTKCLLHPVNRWERSRQVLLDSGISIHKIASLETAYVKSIRKNDSKLIDKAFKDKEIDSVDLAQLGVGIASFLAQHVITGGN